MGTLWTLQSSQPGLSFYSALPLAYGTSYYAISLSINIVLTILIVIRLIQYRKTAMAALPEEHAKHYLSIVTVLVESAALYSIFALLFLITYAINNPINQVMLGIAQATQVSTLFIEYPFFHSTTNHSIPSSKYRPISSFSALRMAAPGRLTLCNQL